MFGPSRLWLDPQARAISVGTNNGESITGLEFPTNRECNYCGEVVDYKILKGRTKSNITMLYIILNNLLHYYIMYNMYVRILNQKILNYSTVCVQIFMGRIFREHAPHLTIFATLILQRQPAAANLYCMHKIFTFPFSRTPLGSRNS